MNRYSAMDRGSERGSVTVFTVIMTITLIFVAGLVVDGGQILNAKREAANVAESAARAGAQEVDEDAVRAGEQTRIDDRRAVARAETFLVANGYQGTVSVNGNTVIVNVTARQPMLILGIGGLRSVTVHGAGSASPIRSITGTNP
jgi:Flp pilus assembly protein TadG